jgi:hypothetical protein
MMLLSSTHRIHVHRFFEQAGFRANRKRGFGKYRSQFFWPFESIVAGRALPVIRRRWPDSRRCGWDGHRNDHGSAKAAFGRIVEFSEGRHDFARARALQAISSFRKGKKMNLPVPAESG